MMIKIKTVLFLLLLIMCFSISACTQKPDVSSSDSSSGTPSRIIVDYNIVSQSEALAQSHVVVRAKYTGECVTFDDHIELKFEPSDVIVGSVSDKMIFVSSAKQSDGYEKGKEYILILKKTVSVYYSHDKYSFAFYNGVQQMYFPIEDLYHHIESFYEIIASKNGLHSEYEEVYMNDESTYKLFSAFLKEFILSNRTEEFAGREYIRSEEFGDIAENTPHIVRLKILGRTEIYDDFVEYDCEVVEELKGILPLKEISVCFLPASVTEENEYIVFLSNYRYGGSYMISAKKAVYTTDEYDAMYHFES